VVEAEEIAQGDVFWIDLGRPFGSEPGFRRPFVVVQSNLFNQTALQTVVVCALTANLRRAAAPGNVLLDDGEGNLPERSVVNVTQLISVDRQRLGERLGTLSPGRIEEIYRGLQLVLEPLG
jgi:mRNA interferase MazF